MYRIKAETKSLSNVVKCVRPWFPSSSFEMMIEDLSKAWRIWKPKPKFRLGLLVTRTDVEKPKLRYMLITQRRIVCFEEWYKREWVYDGIIVSFQNNELQYYTNIYCQKEEGMEFISQIV